MLRNKVKATLGNGGAAVGSFANIESPTVVEVLGLAGLDFVVLDAEHTPVNPEHASDIFRAGESVDLPVMTRIGENTQQVIQKFMDAGSLGVMMPLVNSGADAKRVVESVKYPPEGRRGLASTRANRYGLADPLGEYVAKANAETMVIVQIETQQAIDCADEIIGTDGVDVVFLGPTDLSVALGVPGQVKHVSVLDTITSLAARIEAAGKAAGTIARTPEDYAYWRERGVRFFLTGATQLLAQATRQFVEGIRDVEASKR